MDSKYCLNESEIWSSIKAVSVILQIFIKYNISYN